VTDVTNLGDPRNASQVQYWNGARTVPWVVLQERLDKYFEPLSHAAMHLAAVQPDEHALDIGCGCGANVLDLADRVGPTGAVLGVDISAPMLDHARKRIAAAGLGNATVVCRCVGASFRQVISIWRFPAWVRCFLPTR
jgi:cyclopropane fatty-acyl-phospholipid synthase-like methyltransferase